jgi:hypothetical protein
MRPVADGSRPKGQRYSQFFRSAGNMLQRDRLADAIGVLERGAALAREQGDTDIAALFEQELAERRRQLAERQGTRS